MYDLFKTVSLNVQRYRIFRCIFDTNLFTLVAETVG